LVLLCLLLATGGFEIDLGTEPDPAPVEGEVSTEEEIRPPAGESGPGEPLQANKSLALAEAAFGAGDFIRALLLSGALADSGVRPPLLDQAGMLRAHAAVRLGMPRLGIALAEPHLSTDSPGRRDFLAAVGPLFVDPNLAPELARGLRSLEPTDLEPAWQGHFAYWVARFVVIEEIALRERAAAPRKRVVLERPEEAVAEGSSDAFDQIQAEESAKTEVAEDAPNRDPAAEVSGDPAAPPTGVSNDLGAAREVAAAKRSEDNFGRARMLLGYAGKTPKLLGKAHLLAGIIASAQADDERALGHFRTALKRGGSSLRNAVTMQLARTHYAHKQMNLALGYYREISPDSPLWPRALFEQAWAQFRRGSFGRVLGILSAFDSPFLGDEVIAEIEVLRALSFFENCRYDEALAASDRLLMLRPLYDTLTRRLMRDTDPANWVGLLRRRQQIEDDLFSGYLEGLARRAEVVQALAVYSGAEREYARLLGSGVDPMVLGTLERTFRSRFEALAKQTGETIMRGAIRTRVSLADLLKQALAIRVELEEQRTKVMRQQLQGGHGGVIARQTGDPISVADDELWWPQDGEYWRDELATYHLHLGSSCR
jgi:tetratricopeptide (TPR) repeat protein